MSIIENYREDFLVLWSGISLLSLALVVYVTAIMYNLISIFCKKTLFIFRTVDYFYVTIACVIAVAIRYVGVERGLQLLLVEINLAIISVVIIKILNFVGRKVLL